MIKLIAVDMDGTLLQSNNQIGEETKEALKKANEKGIKIVPASGRPLPGVIPYMEELGITGDDNYAVLYNGGLVQSISGNVLISHQFNYDEFRKFLQLQKQNPGVNLHFMKKHDYWTLDRRLTTKMARMSAVSGAPFVIKDFDEIPEDFQFIKAEYTGPEDKIDQLEKNIPEWLKNYNVARSDPMILEINKLEASKGSGIHQLAQKLGIRDDEVMIFGDQGNDMSMFQNSDFHKVAMGNAIDAIKAKADFVTKTNDEAGIAYAIDKFIKC
ncbi:MAG: Cof-type HAD-IIB family hydrolase [Lactobacillus sp.]